MSEVKVPELGESIVEATVGTWLKKVGDPVEAGEALVELETDKVNVEVMAEEAGVLQSIVKQSGETVNIGETLAVIGAAGSAPAPAAAAASTAAAPSASSAAASVATAPAPAPAAPAATPAAAAPAAEAAETGPVRATPAIRRAALEFGVDLSKVHGTGENGRIELRDLLAHVTPPASAPAAPAAPTKPAPAPAATTAVGSFREEERVRMSRRRATIAKRLVEAQHTAAMLTTFNEVDMTAILEVRKRRKDAFKEKHGVGLGFMSFFTKAVVGALKAFPLLNAEIQGEDLIIKKYYDIGVAVATEGGLVVPVVRNADRLSFAEIEREIATLAKKARENKLSLQDLQGGTFTITNGGVFGSLMSTPILNAPQVGILGMHGIKERPVAVNGQVEIRPMMYIALSYDHRIVDGAEAVQFLVKVKELVEDPESLLIEG
ncbi:dihydrolipoyllysine-residue succinyltransferase component of 2-oxoglutarate dehydrogenase complex [Alicyclobacillus contaminans]|uniref:2-oxoglutarate dehydrogenase complex dihydrolipoyllysine-residue succinyltransferase n=1 Tax=Alicyclobacillus contaminans TaxID=392016 RepID=UPI0004185A81|nr:2-oxoglutarate dehydrogenase complex dihydrolipoyllysine-residue succinyltransferase [Alicyclobacillus contaminans]GMA50672.1 dihydrolipoyllysine-residue succinyltransferase component of 2-oxoglutarate dehydrogenase complex [Alicyclobacillus contaminans]